MKLESDVHPLAKLAGAKTGEKQRALAQCLAGQRAPVDAGAAEFMEGFDDDGLMPEIRSLSGPFFTRRPAANHNQFIVIFRHVRPLA
jgi:hypothetical protein